MALSKCLSKISSNKTIQQIWRKKGFNCDLFKFETFEERHKSQSKEMMASSFFNDNVLGKYCKVSKKEWQIAMDDELNEVLKVNLKNRLSFVIAEKSSDTVVCILILYDFVDLPPYEDDDNPNEDVWPAKYLEIWDKLSRKREENNSIITYDGSKNKIYNYKRGDILVVNTAARDCKYNNIGLGSIVCLVAMLIAKMLNFKQYWLNVEDKLYIKTMQNLAMNMSNVYVENTFLFDNKFILIDCIITYNTTNNNNKNTRNENEYTVNQTFDIGQYYQSIFKCSQNIVCKL